MGSSIGNPSGFIAPNQGIYEQSNKRNAFLGRELDMLDGRVFKYCKASGNIGAGDYVQSVIAIVAHTNLVVGAVGVGENAVIVTLGATLLTANQYAEGYLVINAGLSKGVTYKIKSHPECAALASVRIVLYDDTLLALDATSRVTLVKHTCDGVSIQATQGAVGVGISPIAVTDGNFFWALVKGCNGVITQEATPIGSGIAASVTIAGRVDTVNTLGEIASGRMLTVGVVGECRPAFIDLD